MKDIVRDLCKTCKARRLTAFANLSDEELAEIDRVRTLVEYKEDSSLPLNFDGEDGFYCIRKGHQKINVKNKNQIGTVRISGPGDLVGYGAGDKGKHTVHALEDGVACFFSRKTFQTLLAKSPAVSLGLIEALSKIILLKDSRIANLENYSVKNRVASLLLSLNSKFGAPSKLGSLIDVKIDRETLAKLAGTGLESLSRTLTILEEDKLIQRAGRKIHLINIAALQKVADS